MKFLQKVRVEIDASTLAFVAANPGLLIAAIGPAWVPDGAVADSVLLIGASPRKEEFSSRMPLFRPLYCGP